jgi:tetratricopeptide (TPR) repeat protein
MSFRFWRRTKNHARGHAEPQQVWGIVVFRAAWREIFRWATRATVGLSRTGLFYTKTLPTGGTGRRGKLPTTQADTSERPTLGFFKRLVTPENDQAFVNGCRELALGDSNAALAHLQQATHLADGAYLAGFLALKDDQLDTALRDLSIALEQQDQPGLYFAKSGVSSTIDLPISEEVAAEIGPDKRGVLLGLVEICQRQNNWAEAKSWREKLRVLAPDDVVIKLSLAELLLEAHPDDKAICLRIVKMTAGVTNQSAVHAALMLYKARALRQLDLLAAARDTLTAALRRKRDRPDDLLDALCYESALVYGRLGQKSRARSEFEKLYATMPDYEDVAYRLGF